MPGSVGGGGVVGGLVITPLIVNFVSYANGCVSVGSGPCRPNSLAPSSCTLNSTVDGLTDAIVSSSIGATRFASYLLNKPLKNCFTSSGTN